MANTTSYPANGDRTPAAQAQRETHWRRLVDRCGKSGLTQSAFCRREGISENSLSWWLRELRERDQSRRSTAAKKVRRRKRAQLDFAPVRIIDAAPAAEATPIDVLMRGGRTVRIMPGFDVPTLRRVIAALEGVPC